MYRMQHIYKQTALYTIFYAWFECMHTRVDIVLCDKSEEESKEIGKLISDELYKLQKIGDFYDPSSNLYRLNNILINKPVYIDIELFTIVKLTIEYNKKTLGYFDISVQSENYASDSLQQVLLSDTDLSIAIKREGVKLDLSGFIKGYALDKVRAILKDNGIHNALINMGNSSVLAIGNHPLGNGWKVGFSSPAKGDDENEITLKDECLTTSGNDTDIRKHIISPHTGQYIEGQRKVAVITHDGAAGEALSIALFVAEPHEKQNILQHFEAKTYNL